MFPVNKTKLFLYGACFLMANIGVASQSHAQSHDFDSSMVLLPNSTSPSFHETDDLNSSSFLRIRELTERSKRVSRNFALSRHNPTRPPIAVKPDKPIKPGTPTRPPIASKPKPGDEFISPGNPTRPPVETKPPEGGRIFPPVEPGNQLMGNQGFRQSAQISNKGGVCGAFVRDENCR